MIIFCKLSCGQFLHNFRSCCVYCSCSFHSFKPKYCFVLLLPKAPKGTPPHFRYCGDSSSTCGREKGGEDRFSLVCRRLQISHPEVFLAKAAVYELPKGVSCYKSILAGLKSFIFHSSKKKRTQTPHVTPYTHTHKNSRFDATVSTGDVPCTLPEKNVCT